MSSQNGKEVLDRVIGEILSGQRPPRYEVGAPFGHLPLAPRQLVALAGPPGVGKTALVLQLVTDLLQRNTGVSVLMANVEMPPDELTRRILSRLSGVAGDALADNHLTGQNKRKLQAAAKTYARIAKRLCFLDHPFELAHVGDEMKGANVLVADYIQRFTVGGEVRDAGEERTRLNDVMGYLRLFCDGGACVLAVSAVSRQKGHKGSNYTNLGLASLRGSSELEYGADAVYLMEAEDGNGSVVKLENAKLRYGRKRDVRLRFHGDAMRFTDAAVMAGGTVPSA